MIKCPNCQTINPVGTAFCSHCGKQFFSSARPVNQPSQAQPIKNKKNLQTVLIVLAVIFGTCLLCGGIGVIKESLSPQKENAVSNFNIFTEADKKRDENLQKAKSALNENYDEKSNKFGNLDEAEKLVSDIHRYDKQYNEAQEIIKEIKRRKEIIAAIPATEINNETVAQEDTKNPPDENNQPKSLKSAPTVEDKIDTSGATAKCRDGSLSYSAHRRGACSRHGGVAVWY